MNSVYTCYSTGNAASDVARVRSGGYIIYVGGATTSSRCVVRSSRLHRHHAKGFLAKAGPVGTRFSLVLVVKSWVFRTL